MCIFFIDGNGVADPKKYFADSDPKTFLIGFVFGFGYGFGFYTSGKGNINFLKYRQSSSYLRNDPVCTSVCENNNILVCLHLLHPLLWLYPNLNFFRIQIRILIHQKVSDSFGFSFGSATLDGNQIGRTFYTFTR
jgi:hypothetical protein